MKRKSQIKMFETIAVLVVFFFLIVFGVSFYFVIQRASLNRQIERNSQLISISMTQKISDLPELDCALTGIRIDNCIDAVKLDKFKSLLDDPNEKVYYYEVFGDSRVNLRTVFPEGTAEILLYEREPESYSAKYSNFIPMIVFHPVQKKYDFAVLEVTTYVT